MKISQQALAIVALALAAASPVWAQVRCTMPNQKVITLQTASKCPIDALKAETLDGRVITPSASERPAPRPSAVQAKPVAPKPIENHIVQPRREERVEPFDAARTVCTVIQDRKVGRCSIDQVSGPTRIPVIRVTTDGTIEELRSLCMLLAKTSKDLSKGSMEGIWSIKVFSKHDIFTPVASCRV